MKYVYILESLNSQHFYIGITDDLQRAASQAQCWEVRTHLEIRTWRIKTYVLRFSDEAQAVAFEKYLKSASGRAFAKKRL